MRYIIGIFLFGFLILPVTVQSQDSINVEEIIVTATKTEKTLQEVPVAVSVVTADTIEKANITDIYDLRSIIPSLDSRRFTTPTEATYVIRGFGNGSYNPGIEPSVAVFIDGGYRSSMQAQIADLPAIERIEVLRGPQSTLFGKNATAGVINVVTKKPSFEKSSYVTASVGSNNMKKFKYYKTGPLDESKAYSFYANLHKADGHSENITTGNTSNNRDRFSVRGEMLFDLANEASLRLTVDYDEYDDFIKTIEENSESNDDDSFSGDSLFLFHAGMVVSAAMKILAENLSHTLSFFLFRFILRFKL